VTEARVFWIPGPPIAFARPGRNPLTGKRYNPHRYQGWRDAAAWELRRQAVEPYAGPVTLTLEVHPDGISVLVASTLTEHRPAGLTADLDNYVKAVGDALKTAGVLGDDRQVVALRAVFDDRRGSPGREGEAGPGSRRRGGRR
jgi:Holliday junction resolvase RusA-like endonuclease